MEIPGPPDLKLLGGKSVAKVRAKPSWGLSGRVEQRQTAGKSQGPSAAAPNITGELTGRLGTLRQWDANCSTIVGNISLGGYIWSLSRRFV